MHAWRGLVLSVITVINCNIATFLYSLGVAKEISTLCWSYSQPGTQSSNKKIYQSPVDVRAQIPNTLSDCSCSRFDIQTKSRASVSDTERAYTCLLEYVTIYYPD